MTHKTWPPPVGTLLILTDAEHLHVPCVFETTTTTSGGVTRVHTRPIEETDNDQA